MLSNNINLRKIGVMFLIFTLVFTGLGVSSGMPVSYAASSEVFVSSGGDDTNGDGTVGKPYATLSKAYSQISDGGTGTIYLLDNITQTTKNGEALKLNLDKRVTITTAPGVNTVTIKRGEPSGTNALDTHFDLTKGELTLKNIIIDSNFNNQKINGRIVNVFGGSQLIIEEGAVLRGSNSGFSGSVIHVDNTGSVVVMKGGEIRGNNSTGAAVLVDNGSQFIMTGGLITDNIGGGVSFRSTPGGMLLLSGDARITGNTNSSGKALNVNMANYKNLILDGVFTGEAGITTQSILPGTQFGQATDAGLGSVENLIADSGSILASYDANKNLVWRAFKNDLSKPSADGEVMGKKPTLTGVTEPLAKVTIKIVSEADQSIVVSKEVTADGNGDWVLPVDMVLSTGAYTISVTANKNKTQSGTVTRQFEVSSDVYVSSGGSDTTGDGTRNNPYATLYKGYQEVVDGGTIYVMDNIALSVTADKKYLHLDQNKSVTISTDPNAVDTAVIQRGSGKDAASGESGDIDTPIRLEKGQLTLENIIIDAKLGEDFYRGRIINVYNDSKLIIEEGAILRNSSSSFGGTAIYLKGTAPQKAVIEMRGGEITGNKHSTSEHSAVLIVDNADFIMSGGKITDNSGGGVELSTNTNTRLVLSGTAQITGNSGLNKPERNVILQGNTLLTLNDDFTGEAGITAHNRMAVGANFGVAARAGLQGLGNLFADNGHLLASYAEGNNNLVWRSFKNELTQPSTNGETTGTKPTLKGVTEPFAKVTIKIVSAADPTFVITEERTADANGNWEFPVDKALSTGAYTVNVTASINNNQSETVTRQFEVVDKTALQGKYDEITAENLVETEY
ncbi:Ig-like domain-containing protein, partial [Paenibacillus sp. MDMC362]|uniref:Ig-like domain-containing protein n=1 Tax=Paenibacillus sp. MDMC362 TaxID=2977365 RepID=UPI000DC59EEA